MTCLDINLTDYIVCKASVSKNVITAQFTLDNSSASNVRKVIVALWKLEGGTYKVIQKVDILIPKGKWAEVTFTVNQSGKYGVAPYFGKDTGMSDYVCADKWEISV